MSTTPDIPFVVGQWVRGESFYGRQTQIEEILAGPRNWIWLLGTRRIGKTSLLKQLEHLTASRDQGYFPLFWDFQGADDAAELDATFGDALLDAEDRLREAGVALTEVEADDLFASISRLRRRLRANGVTLLLLCDEVEELIGLERSDPAVLRKLRRVLHAQEGVRSVLASTIRLWALAEQQEDTSPFLHGFTPPLFLSRLTDKEALSLIEQTHLPAASRPRLGSDVAATIRHRCDNHPYLTQLLCKRYLELADLDGACDLVASDPMVSHFFSVDFDMLSDLEQRVLLYVADRGATGGDSIRKAFETDSAFLGACLQRLESLGFLCCDAERQLSVANFFFLRWLRLLSSPRRAATSPQADLRPGTQSDEFRLGEWWVRPQLNHLEHGGERVRLEPRVMDLLVFLAERQGHVVSKDEIFAVVWKGQFITDSALTRAIADLRRALGDDARNPRFIATISKRGYRLVAPAERWGIPSLAESSGAAETVADTAASALALPAVFALAWSNGTVPLDPGRHVIGRASEGSVCIPSPKVSRRHAQIVVTATAATLEDLGSRNGTRLNGRRIEQAERLADGDVITIGPDRLTFRALTPEGSTELDLGGR